MAEFGFTNAFDGYGSAQSSADTPSREPPPVRRPPTAHEPPPKYTENTGSRTNLGGPLPERSSELPVIAVMGPTGSGKSTLINTIAGRPVKIGHNLESCTQDIEEFHCKIDDKHVMLVDTPGFNDTHLSDTEILKVLVNWMKDSYKDRQLSGIIYLHSIADARMTGSSLQNLRMFRKLCGDDNLANVILATTKWGITPKENALVRERDLCSDFWSPMIKSGSLVRRFENTEASARYLVEGILHTGKKNFVPRIQHEVVEENKSIAQTDAGTYIDKTLIEQAKKHQEEMKVLLKERVRAQKEHDRVMHEAIEKERESLEKKMVQQEEERRILHLDEMGALNKRIEELYQRVKDSGPIYVNKREWWRHHWKCSGCMKKTYQDGIWTCPHCKVKHLNNY